MDTTSKEQRLVILVLRRQMAFEIVGAELRRVPELGRYMTPLPRLRSEQLQADDPLHALVSLCEELLPGSLYSRFANKKLFKRESDFWATDDKTLIAYVKQQADQRLQRAVLMAAEVGVPILFAPTADKTLHIEQLLQVQTTTTVTPMMDFRRRADGMSYQLRLRIDGQPTALVGRSLTVLAYNPGLFILDGHLYLLSPGFSAKLLLPFVKKTVVEIPRHIENDYLRRFIIRHVAKVEVKAEGFDIKDVNISPTPRLLTNTTIDGRWVLTLRFSYNGIDYQPDSTTKGRVTLTETDDTFCFVRQLRNVEQEQHLMEMLRQTGLPMNSSGYATFDRLKMMVEWLQQHVMLLRKEGFEVVQPSERVYYIGPLSVEQNDTWCGDWLQTEITVVLDEGRLRIPFRQLASTILNGDQDYMLPTGERLVIPTEWLKRYGSLLLMGRLRGNVYERHRSQVIGFLPDTVSEESGENGSFDDKTNGVSYTPPLLGRAVSGEAYSLRPYQVQGFVWLWRHLLQRTGCCLADEMGLGKTIQTIALLLKYKLTARMTRSQQPQAGFLFSDEEMSGGIGGSSNVEGDGSASPTLLPFKTSLVVAPTSLVHNWMNELRRFAPTLLVLNYTGSVSQRRSKRETLERWDVVITTYGTLSNDIDYLSTVTFGVAVFDESQTFKTHTSKVFQAVRRLQPLHCVALSGTPVENNLMELWSLMNIITPKLLGNAKNFNNNFVKSISEETNEERSKVLKQLIAPYFLKRTKDEVLNDLPERQDEVVVCTMTDEQAKQYVEELSKARNEWLDGSQTNAQKRMNMMAALQRLRMIANGRGKIETVFDMLESLRDTGHKVLLFSEYVTMLNSVGSEMKRRGWRYDLLTGQTTQRNEVIDHFQETADCQFFLISLKAGGVGLNLTAADYVFLLDPWWNLAAEEQAISRAHRIGQHRPVFVYRFVSADTLEEQILTVQERKQNIIDGVMPFITGISRTKG